MTTMWKENWDQAIDHHLNWWKRDGFVLTGTWWDDVTGVEHAKTVDPGPPASLEQRYLDAEWRAAEALHRLAHGYFVGDQLPLASTDIGPGSLATMIGSEPGLAETTVWYNPCIDDPDLDEPIVFDPDNRWWQVHRAIITANVAASQGHYMVGCPDLVENIDTLASLRGSQPLLYDMIERPDWVHHRLGEINQVWFDVYGRIYDLIKQPDGASAWGAFHLYGLGRTAKLQCDACAMFSPDMFADFVAPYLAEQCEWLDNALYHLDGTGCIVHLDHLLAIDALDVIEWTPESGREPGGTNPKWWPMYRRILDAGKSVQIVGGLKDEVLPMVRELGAKGLYVMVGDFEGHEDFQALYDAVDAYR